MRNVDSGRSNPAVLNFIHRCAQRDDDFPRRDKHRRNVINSQLFSDLSESSLFSPRVGTKDRGVKERVRIHNGLLTPGGEVVTF